MNSRVFSFAAVVVLTTLGCASSPSVAQQEQSSASIRAAEEVGAKQVPTAALYLQLAKEEFEASKHEGDRDRASRLLARAQADSELALALARGEKERGEARAALDQVNQAGTSPGAL
jgi:hypothetical protein